MEVILPKENLMENLLQDVTPRKVYELETSTSIAASHHLYLLPEGHKCARQHGHNYDIIVRIRSYSLNDKKMVIDFGQIKEEVRKLDHRDLNEILPDHPTAEHIAEYLAEKIVPKLEGLLWIDVKITVYETRNNRITLYIRNDKDPVTEVFELKGVRE